LTQENKDDQTGDQVGLKNAGGERQQRNISHSHWQEDEMN
jgi:hypothetical protein